MFEWSNILISSTLVLLLLDDFSFEQFQKNADFLSCSSSLEAWLLGKTDIEAKYS